MARPERAAGLLARMAAAAPPRVAKRVNDDPTLAERWSWAADGGATVVTADDIVVRIAGPVATPESLSCTCLLAPKCLHLLAVVAALPEGDAAPAPEAAVVDIPHAPPVDTTFARGPLVALVALGAQGADAGVRAELDRVAYAARGAGLFRLGRAVTRVVRDLRLLQAGHPTFALAEFVADLSEALLVTRGLARSASPDLVGEARRAYVPVGSLRLWGVFSEPVLAGNGVAGVVTWLIDDRGALWQVADLRPRPPGQVAALYDVAPPLTVLAHRQLCREGLHVAGATAAEGRLGAGAGVSAVRAGGARWAALPLRSQGDLRFVDADVVGLCRDGLLLRGASGDVLLVPGSEHASLPWRENLRLLARAPGTSVRLVGRVVTGRPRTLVGLALSADLPLTEARAGRVNLGLDRLASAEVPPLVPEPVRVEREDDRSDALVLLRRRVERAALAGVASLPGEALGAVARDVARLREAAAPGAADLLAALARGEGVFADAWLAAAHYLAAADAERARREWE